MRRTCSGVALYRIDIMKALIATDLPVPVEPAMSRCGMVARSATAMRPLMSLPRPRVSLDLEPMNSAASMFSRSQMISRSRLGTWMPTVDLPAMRSTRMLSALRARQRSSVRFVMRLYFTPASGLNSKVVTTGPGLICVTWPWTSNSEYFSVRTWARILSSSASTDCCPSGRCSRLLGGSLKPPAILGSVVLCLGALSARSVTSGTRIPASARGAGLARAAGSGPASAAMRSIPVRRGGSALLQFVLRRAAGALFLPVAVAVAEGEGEGEAGRDPDLHAGEGERGRQVQGHRQHGGADNVGAGQVQVVNEEVCHDPAH